MKNYALIIEGFESLLTESFTKKDKKMTSKILSVIKENKNISKLYAIVDNLKRGKVTNETVDTFINENIQFAKSISFDKIKYPFDSKTVSEDKLTNAIGLLLFEAKNVFNLSEYNEAYQYVKSKLVEASIVEENTTKKLATLTESYHMVDNDDKILIETFLKTPKSERRSIFESKKIECSKLISEHIQNENSVDTKIKMYEVKDEILNMEFNENNYISDMVKIHTFAKELK